MHFVNGVGDLEMFYDFHQVLRHFGVFFISDKHRRFYDNPKTILDGYGPPYKFGIGARCNDASRGSKNGKPLCLRRCAWRRRDQEHISSSLPNNINNSIAHDPLPPSLPSTSSLHSTTYIVQVPKDQVYRVPPPENALIAERCRTNPNKSRKPLSSLCKFFVVLAIFIAAVIIIILVFYLALTAKDPTFRVEHIVTKSIRKTSPNPSHGHIPGDMFHVYVSLRSKNPNHHMSINYDEGREGWLTFRKRKIAKGESKTLHQASNDSAVLVIDFISVAGATLPGETNKKIRDDKQLVMTDQTGTSYSGTSDVQGRLDGIS
ncbi:hypothetical protein Sjap_022181 [Stephania japonica]|uniref:Late embryogenesis abundant protein LEA-2 subgroup domain-containing protein n=1 Tax=Stephania japonica TaxID=461633 RepID=A0AAP0EX67_9MAGN